MANLLSDYEKEMTDDLVAKGLTAGEIAAHLNIDRSEDKKIKAIRNRVGIARRKAREAGEEIVRETQEIEEVLETEEVEEDIVCYQMIEDIVNANFLDDSQKVSMIRSFYGIEED